MKKRWSWLVVLALAAALFFLRVGARPPQTGSLSPAAQVQLLVTFGLNASAAESWDGTVTVTGGRLAALEGRQFMAGDAITGPASWRCSTRRDAIAPYASIHYTEMRPGSQPEVLFHPVGLYVALDGSAAARVVIETRQGNFSFALAEISAAAKAFLDGRVTVVRVPPAEKLTTGEFEDDEPAIAAGGGAISVAWVAYRENADQVLLRTLENGAWSAAEPVTPAPADIFRCALAAGANGDLWAFWSQRDGDRWHIRGRQKKNGRWQPEMKLTADGSNVFPRAAGSGDGHVVVAWQSFRNGQSDIYIKALSGGVWSGELRISESPANDWEPAVAAAPGGAAYIAWDSYDRGNYDIHFRAYRDGRLAAAQAITSSPRFQAHASVAVDAAGRPWVAWDESGVNWGKDQGFMIVTPLAVPLHQERAVRLAMWDGSGSHPERYAPAGGRWMEPRRKVADALPAAMRQNAEHPQILFDGNGALVMLFRHWTRRESRMIGSPMVWENYLTRFDGGGWSAPVPLPHSGGSIEKHAAMARGPAGDVWAADVWAAWMSDDRPFHTMVPQNAEVYAARLGAGSVPAAAAAATVDPALAPFTEPFTEAIPVHPSEAADVKAIRTYAISAGGKQFRIYRGDMHRHTDVSTDFKYDGSLIEVYRYGLDAAGFDYIAPADHQTGFDQEFTWWQSQKLVDVFLAPGSFTPLFAYERSLRFPNGHRNIVFAHRGVRTLPIPPDEAKGVAGAARLFEHLRRNRGISMPHSMATDQGTDWRDNDPAVEPLVEIFQGYRNSYEYEGAPRAATESNLHAQKSGWQPSGFWWNALAKGYKLGVQASSDHWSTHISYACLLAESFTREGLLDAIRRRHAYAATDNIILDFRARSGGATYIMGDAFSSRTAPLLAVRAIGTGPIQQIDLIKNQAFVYTARPGTKEAAFEFRDNDFRPGKNYYYVRVLQQDGQLAWSSPIWVE